MHRVVRSFTFAVTLRVIARSAKPSDAEVLTKLFKNLRVNSDPKSVRTADGTDVLAITSS